MEEEKKIREAEELTLDETFGSKDPVSDVLPKIIVLGDSKIGKTSVIAQISKNTDKRVKAAPT